MSHDLAELLEAATPEPQRLLNPEELLRAARRRVTVRRRAGAGLGAAVVAGAVTATLLVPSGGNQSSGATGGTDTPVVSALQKTSPLPATVTRALAQSPYISTGRGTLTRQIGGGEQVYLVPVNDGELICIVDVVGAKENSLTCAPRSGLLSTGVYLTTQLNETSPAQALIVAPDGYTTATSGTTTASVADNLAVLRPLSSETVTLTGPHRPSVTLHVGPFGFPPAPAKDAHAAPTEAPVLPGGDVVTHLAAPVTVDRTGSAVVEIGTAPAGADHIEIKLGCLTAGTFTVADGASLTCSAADAGTATGAMTYELHVKAGQHTTTITTTDSSRWRLSVTYSKVTTSAWGVNTSGQTFGVTNANGTPTLVAVIATNGKTGYSYARDLAQPQPANPSEALAAQNAPQREVDVPVYTPDGKTVIGTFATHRPAAPK